MWASMHGMNRREFLAASGAASAGMLVFPALGSWAREVEMFFEWKTINDKVRVGFGQGGNSTIIASGGEVLLIDTKNSPFGDVLRRESSAGAKLVRVVNTHHHADHTGGNHAFTKDIPVLAHEKAAARVVKQVDRYIGQIKQAIMELDKTPEKTKALILDDFKKLDARKGDLKPEEFKPTETMGDQKELTVGATKLVLKHVGPGHTDNDVFIYIPDANVMVAGDLVFRRMHPFIDRDGGATTVGWRASCRAMMEMCDAKTVVVPGHGEITDKSGIQEQITYFDDVCEQIGRLVKDGRTRNDARGFVSPKYADYARPEGRPLTFGAIFDELDEAGKAKK